MQSQSDSHIHEWQFDNRGYAYCKKCGSATSRSRCIVCKKESPEPILILSELGNPIKFCSRSCLKKHLEGQ